MSKLSVKSPLWRLTWTRAQLFFREPSALFWTYGFPVLVTVALGVAFRDRPPDPVVAAVEAGAGAEALRAELASSPMVKARILPPAEAEAALKNGRVAVVVRHGNPRVYLFDPARPEDRLARAVVDDVLQRAEGRRDPTPVTEARISEPGSRYIDFLVPGLIGFNLMSVGMWGIGYVVADNRQRKLLKRMVATPMRRSEFLLSFVLMRMLFVLPELVILLGLARLVFAVPLRGSFALFLAVALLGALAFSGLGLLAGARAKSTQSANGLINLITVPMWLLSGVFFSYSNFPERLQPAIRLLPLTALNDAMRAVMNEGAGWRAVEPQIVLLAAVAAVSFGAALRIFRWS